MNMGGGAALNLRSDWFQLQSLLMFAVISLLPVIYQTEKLIHPSCVMWDEFMPSLHISGRE